MDMSDPANVVHQLVAAGRVAPAVIDQASGMLVVLGYREIHDLARDRRLAGVGLTFFDYMGVEGRLREWYGELLFATEGEYHSRMRRLVSRAFTPRSIEQLRPFTRDFVADTFTGIEADGKGDLARLFARLGTRVMCQLLGVPQTDVDVFADWADALSRVFGFMDPEQIAAASTALDGLLDYTAELVERRDHEPSGDLITALRAAEHEGDRLTRHEVVTLVANLLVAAHDTTASQLSCSLLTLLRHPEALERVRSGDVLAEHALTETMRFEPAIIAFPRTVIEPIEIAAVERPVGTPVMLAVASGNRDPDVYDQPDRFDVARFHDKKVPSPLSFGTGTHFCLGSSLANMAMEETIIALAASGVHLDDSNQTEWKSVLGRSPVNVPVLL
jgi:cytochrome P450